ncbi:5-oxoprolinase subunit PxpA [Georgenia halophila]|uniref:5-oxoprolinase subunit A n=1 Tax=Georgenia halophila TaxID=620889 RepID=A0ABP8L988_9MICO
MATIDLNSDMGEGFGRWELGDDEAMLGVVTSANIACGFHAGDPEGLGRTVEAAHRRGVVIGAHPAYRDLAGFGRRYVDATPAELRADVIYQVGALQGLARSVGATVHYVKAHGALYNTIAHDELHASAVLAAVKDVDPSLVVLGLAGSPLLDKAREAGLAVCAEAFADRAYTSGGELVSRREPGAVLHDPDVVAERMVRLVESGTIEAIDGSAVRVRADSICVHSDSPGAVAMARQVRSALARAGVGLRAFAGPAG